MDFDRKELIPISAVIYGSLVVFFMVLIITTCLAIATELGWTGTVTWPNNSLFLILFYSAVIVGSVMAGWRNGKNGWVVGIGVGLLSSIMLLFSTLLLREPVHLGIFLVKSLISMFIGAFGGIIGVNLSGNQG